MTVRPGLMARLLAVACLSLLTPEVLAQEAPPAVDADAAAAPTVDAAAEQEAVAEPGIEEIIVTSQKREERIQDVPLSVTAISGDQLEKLSLSRPSDVLTQVPNVKSQAPTGSNGYPIFNIRGITLLDFSDTNEPSVSVYADDIYLGSPAVQNQQLFDVQRVEVLRGPQGTLYGRNATGGLVHFITRKPTKTFEGSLSGEYGSYGDTKVEGIVSGPLADNLRGRFATRLGQRDGWQKNLTTGTELGGVDESVAARGLLEFDASENVLVSANLHYSRFKGDEDVRGFYGKRDPNDTSVTCSIARIRNSECVNTAGFRDPDPDPEHVFSDESELPASVENTGGSVHVKWDLGGMEFVSITGYEKAEKIDTIDADAAPVSATRTTLEYNTDHEQLSQEFRLSGVSGRLNWVSGLYYYTDDRFITTLLTRVAGGLGTFADQTVETGALFGQATWALTEQLNLTGGLRYTSEQRDLKNLTRVSGGRGGTREGTPLFTVSDKISLDKVTGRLALDWKLARDLLLYSSVSTGFKSGAYNTVLTSSAAAVGPVDPENITAYELGIKSTFWQGRAFINAATFYYDYKNIQAVGSVGVSDGAPPTTLFINVGNGEIVGAEAEAGFRPIDGLTISLGLGLLDTEIKSDPGTTYNGVALNGNQLVAAPKFSYNGVVRYERPIANYGFASAQTDFQWQDDVFFGPDNLPTETESAYGLINVALGWASPEKRYEVDAFVKNLTDKEYGVHATDLGDFVGRNWGLPRTMGLRLKYLF